jgi:small subunit ribosomal protein S8
MSLQDPVADMLTCIRNAQAMGIQELRLPHSRLKSEILRVLKEEGFIENFSAIEIAESTAKKVLQVTLKYYQGRPVIEKINRISRPALRIYRGYDQLPIVRGGLGISIVSTPKGVMADKTARSQQVGGEVLCTVE